MNLKTLQESEETILMEWKYHLTQLVRFERDLRKVREKIKEVND